ncbi:hypothetical protein EDE08_1177 [Bradyrhizobium sp. R2.2-H]|jgi:hypothetical protein|uniref:hypothetical protein n=1 Tax=unclassified Bradyrhizobium TaxID=2631580 RepID=UPI00104AAD46|nr:MULTISPECIES: hypothetical protein [unclassified Bradyrhizobium]TCU64086.1 hypothetical protein EDE10_117139 [Bradyrhizobium sp. Y-H1]TCU65824.1 hypothetical protein EDE08_1177 [Bradyrhizobium sp. R2.2-H]
MLNKSLMLLSAMAFCLTTVSILLSDVQQRALSLWNIRAWSAMDQCRQTLVSSGAGKLMREDTPLITALATAGMLLITPLWMAVFALFLIPNGAAFLGGLLFACEGALDWKGAEIVALTGAIAGVSLTGVIITMKQFFLATTILVVAALLLPLSALEFVARRIAEYDKGPLVALGVLVTAALAFFKALL